MVYPAQTSEPHFQKGEAMRFRAALIALMFVAGFTRGEEPKINGPEKLTPYKIARYTAVNVGATDGVLWRVTPVPVTANLKKSDVDFGLLGKRNGREIEFVAPPGVYEVTLIVVKQPVAAGGSLEISEVVLSLTIGVAPTPPKPPVPPAPKPKPKPPEPAPMPKPKVDAELVVKYKTALDVDTKAKFPMGGAKSEAAKLADVYLFAAEKLASVNEADWPKTVGALFETVGGVSVSQKIPRLPYLSNVRGVSGETLGSYDSASVLDSAMRANFAEKFKRAGLALKEASK